MSTFPASSEHLNDALRRLQRATGNIMSAQNANKRPLIGHDSTDDEILVALTGLRDTCNRQQALSSEGSQPSKSRGRAGVRSLWNRSASVPRRSNQIPGAVTFSGSAQSNTICSGSRRFAFFGQHRCAFEPDPATFAVASLVRSDFRPSCGMRSAGLARAQSTQQLRPGSVKVTAPNLTGNSRNRHGRITASIPFGSWRTPNNPPGRVTRQSETDPLPLVFDFVPSSLHFF
jgi:hypothetical protein